LPQINVEYAGTTVHDLSLRVIRLVREEYVLLFYLGHNSRVQLDLVMMDVFATDCLAHLNEARLRALEADYGIARPHVTLQFLEPNTTVHT
jgi:hypothetical protein